MNNNLKHSLKFYSKFKENREDVISILKIVLEQQKVIEDFKFH